MLRSGFFSSLTDVVKHLLIINVLVFLAEMVFGLDRMIGSMGLWYIDSPNFNPYQIATHMFMHGGFMHLFVNMFALWMFGSPLERLWGPKRFLVFYLFTGLGAAFFTTFIDAAQIYNLTGSIMPLSSGELDTMSFVPEKVSNIYRGVAVGASGAIFGLLLGFGMSFPNQELIMLFFPVPIKAKYFVILYGLFELYAGTVRMEGDNIGHFAHLGGLIFGFILIKFWQYDKRRFY